MQLAELRRLTGPPWMLPTEPLSITAELSDQPYRPT